MFKRFFHCFLFFFLPATLSSCDSQPVANDPSAIFYEVSKVIDGDTFYIYNSGSKEERIRLIGIDAPESRRSQHKEVGYFGKEASDYLKKLLSGKRVRLEYDIASKDRYGRTLAYAYLENGTFINALLVKQGYATLLTVPPNVKYSKLFYSLQQEARKNSLGMWNNK